MANVATLARLAVQIRRDILLATSAAGSGHPTSSLSAVEIVTALFFGGIFRARVRQPMFPHNDRFILSKGHAAPLLYALYASAGALRSEDVRHLRRFGSPLEGHPMPRFPFADVATGSLGQGLSVGVGIALHARQQRSPFRTYVLLGDGEMSEGSVWEAIQCAGFQKLSSLTAMLDCNRLGQSGPTMLGHDVQAYARRVRSFGWDAQTVNGHDLQALLQAYRAARSGSRPTMLIARTVKGRGVSFLENKEGWHGKTLSGGELTVALREIGTVRRTRGRVALPRFRSQRPPNLSTKRLNLPQPRYAPAELVAPRAAFGNALVRLAPKFPQMVVLDADVQNSTFTELFARKYPRRFVQAFIAEQHMAGMAMGLASRGALPVAATFAAFWTRAFDQLRMAQYNGMHLVIAGTHAGVSIGPDGPSQMGLEDLALFRTLENATVLYPADAYATERLFERALRTTGIVYLRLTRAAQPMLYTSGTHFPIGGSHTLVSSSKDAATVVSAGITLFAALAAAARLAAQGIAVRVVDCYSVQPVDAPTLRRAARQTARLIVAEDHRPAGGLADAVRTALGSLAGTVTPLAVRRTPHSGTPAQLLAYEQIDADAIVHAVKKLTRA